MIILTDEIAMTANRRQYTIGPPCKNNSYLSVSAPNCCKPCRQHGSMKAKPRRVQRYFILPLAKQTGPLYNKKHTEYRQ